MAGSGKVKAAGALDDVPGTAISIPESATLPGLLGNAVIDKLNLSMCQFMDSAYLAMYR